MGTRSGGRRVEEAPEDLFSVDPSGLMADELAWQRWPAQERFPVNHRNARVRDVLWPDLVRSQEPVLVAGYSAIEELVRLLADWGNRHRDDAVARVLLGTEPHRRDRPRLGPARQSFTKEARDYWLTEHQVSLTSAGSVLAVLELLHQGRVRVRFADGATRLHSKVYVGESAASCGSSNFTYPGLSGQIETNVRFARAEEHDRYRELAQIGDNLWRSGQDWTDEFTDLLRSLLQLVGWRDALARACSELLDGEWAGTSLTADTGLEVLWPSQRTGIAQALWVLENVGSVLVADATGSGKTRMGAHLTRAVHDRLWSTGSLRRDLTVLVCPPAVEGTWRREASTCGLPLALVSHGRLSRRSSDPELHTEELEVRRAQILAVDEAHNFLNPDSNRSQALGEGLPEHVVLLTATPINTGPVDLLHLVRLLGADNFHPEALQILDSLSHRRDQQLSQSELDALRNEIARFTVRRTKADLNSLVELDPDAYVGADGRVCRYPRQQPVTYPTGESDGDNQTASSITAIAAELMGLVQLGRRLEVPDAQRTFVDDATWLAWRLSSANGLAEHRVRASLRSSRAALLEHVAGTERAQGFFELRLRGKATGDMPATLNRLAAMGPPAHDLGCHLPDWLTDEAAWQSACEVEAARYQRIAELATQLSDARERTKAQLLTTLANEFGGVLAFDRHPITLHALRRLLPDFLPVVLADGTGGATVKKRATKTFGRSSPTGPRVGLFSDALNEGLNLQGAAAVVHLDLPTTLRQAEQRIGRVDRMDSPHDAIQVYWPDDGPAFVTSANEALTRRADDSNQLLGANIAVPDQISRRRGVVDLKRHIREVGDDSAPAWDGIRDALAPVRDLVFGPQALIPADVYSHYRGIDTHVIARVAPLRSQTAWAFLSIAGTVHGAPRWMLLREGDNPLVGLEPVTGALRDLLVNDPPSAPMDQGAAALLKRFLSHAEAAERNLLPRRLQAALGEMALITQQWRIKALGAGRLDEADRWSVLHELSEARVDLDEPPEERADLWQLATAWLNVVRPLLEDERTRGGRRPYLLLRDIRGRLLAEPLPVQAVEDAVANVPLTPPISRRVTAAVIGVPSADLGTATATNSSTAEPMTPTVMAPPR